MEPEQQGQGLSFVLIQLSKIARMQLLRPPLLLLLSWLLQLAVISCCCCFCIVFVVHFALHVRTFALRFSFCACSHHRFLIYLTIFVHAYL